MVEDFATRFNNRKISKLEKQLSSIQDNTYKAQYAQAPYKESTFDGEKFPGGYGYTELFITDYWTLRKRSTALFKNNLYARGLVRRLVTNEIHIGLSLAATPNEDILGLSDEMLSEWSESQEARFGIWGKNPKMCDWKQKSTFGSLQRKARREALICGDILVVLRQNKRTNLPMVQLVSGSKVQTPYEDVKIRKGNKIKHGVEVDKNQRVVAHWVKQKDLSFKRIPAYGEKSGRKISWLVYGTDKMLDSLRGEPLLSIILQSIKELDRYRDSTQRKATVNSIITMIVKKNEDKMGSLPVQKSAVRKGEIETTDSDGTPRKFNISGQIPGLALEELQHGEDVILKGGEGTDINFPVFEAAVINAIAWANEIPPEILRLGFTNNYSASQAALNEFKIYLNMIWVKFGEEFCTHVRDEWLISEVLIGNVNAPGLLEAWRDPSKYDLYGAWVSSDWYGSVKPTTDIVKQAKGSKMLTEEGWSTNSREARGITGTKFTQNIKKLKRENELKVEAMRPLAEFKKEFGEDPSELAIAALENSTLELVEKLEDIG